MLRIPLNITLCLLLACSAAVSAAPQYRWSGVERVVAVSDPHGAYEALLTTLRHAEVIDEDGKWAGGKTHLVVVGDMLDRGADSRKIMDLVMRLEGEAPDSGGMVHLTLGNHEVMNLVGDLRYVSPGEYAAFADEESADERERWFQAMLEARRAEAGDDATIDEAALHEQFDKERPPGFYGHRRAFSSTGKYGSWLLQKPLMIVINDSAYVHGGMPEIVAKLGLEGLNDELGEQVRDYVAAVEKVYAAGLMDPAVNFYDQGDLATAIAARDTTPAALQPALAAVAELNHAGVHDTSSPLWYRGTVGCSLLAEGDVIASALAAVGAERVVIGHTPTMTRQVLTRLAGRVIEIDTGMLSAAYHGSGHALVNENGHLTVASEKADGNTVPLPHPRQVGVRSDKLSVGALADLLAHGEIVSTAADEAGRTIVEIARDGRTVSALFIEGPRRKGQQPEIAAYRLDLLIGLDLVPVTVEREIDGKPGTLSFLPNEARDEAYRANTGQGGDAWCPLPRQWNSMYVFDSLIYNEGRTPNSMVYSTQNWQLLSVGYSHAFNTSSGRPKFLAEVPLQFTSTWVDALSSLTDEVLTERLADVLSKRQISALGKRRDALLAEASQ